MNAIGLAEGRGGNDIKRLLEIELDARDCTKLKGAYWGV